MSVGAGGVELEGVGAHVHLVLEALGGDRIVQAGLSDVAPGADHVGPDIHGDQRLGVGRNAGVWSSSVMPASIVMQVQMPRVSQNL